MCKYTIYIVVFIDILILFPRFTQSLYILPDMVNCFIVSHRKCPGNQDMINIKQKETENQ